MKNPLKGDWGLKLLAILLAIVIYHVLKTESLHSTPNDHSLFHYR